MELLGRPLCDYVALQTVADGLQINVMTVRRWIDPGIRGHRLKIIRIGGLIRTTQEWLDSFIAATSDVEPACEATTPTPARSRRGSRHEQAERELARRGL